MNTIFKHIIIIPIIYFYSIIRSHSGIDYFSDIPFISVHFAIMNGLKLVKRGKW